MDFANSWTISGLYCRRSRSAARGQPQRTKLCQRSPGSPMALKTSTGFPCWR